MYDQIELQRCARARTSATSARFSLCSARVQAARDAISWRWSQGTARGLAFRALTKFNNLDYSAYLRRQMLAELKLPNTMDGLGMWMNESDDKKAFVRHSSVNADKGFVFIAQDWMLKMMKGLTAPLSTDAVEGLIKQPPNTSLLCTVGFCPELQRVVPVAISIILGKSSEHYKQHFTALLEGMELDVAESGIPTWNGMVADFSAAQAKAFEETLSSYIVAKRKQLSLSRAMEIAKTYLVVRLLKPAAPAPD